MANPSISIPWRRRLVLATSSFVFFGLAALCFSISVHGNQAKTPPKQWKEKFSVYHKSMVQTVAFSPDDKMFASGSREICLWSSKDGKKLAEIEGGANSLKFTADGKALAIGSFKKVYVWAIDKKAEQKAFAGLTGGPTGLVDGLDITRDGKILAAFDEDAMIVWNMETGEQLFRHAEAGKKLNAIAFSPDGSLLALGSGHPNIITDPGEVSLWNVAEKKMIRRFPMPKGEIRAVAFSPDGNTLAAGGLAKPNFGEPNGGVFLWDLKTFKQSNLKPEHEGNEVFTIAFSPKSNLLASGGSSGILFLWDWSKAEFLDALKTEIKHAGCVRFSSDGSHLLVGGWNGRVQVFSRP